MSDMLLLYLLCIETISAIDEVSRDKDFAKKKLRIRLKEALDQLEPFVDDCFKDLNRAIPEDNALVITNFGRIIRDIKEEDLFKELNDTKK